MIITLHNNNISSRRNRHGHDYGHGHGHRIGFNDFVPIIIFTIFSTVFLLDSYYEVVVQVNSFTPSNVQYNCKHIYNNNNQQRFVGSISTTRSIQVPFFPISRHTTVTSSKLSFTTSIASLENNVPVPLGSQLFTKQNQLQKSTSTSTSATQLQVGFFNIASTTTTASTSTSIAGIENDIWIQFTILLFFSFGIIDIVFETIFVRYYKYTRERILNDPKLSNKGNITYATDKEADDAFESTIWYSAVNSITKASQVTLIFYSIYIVQTLFNIELIPPIINTKQLLASSLTSSTNDIVVSSITDSTTIVDTGSTIIDSMGNSAVVDNMASATTTSNSNSGIVPLPVAGRNVGFITYIGLTVSTIKRTIFLQSVSGTELGRVILFDRLFDFIIIIACIVNIIDAIQIDIGMGIMSFVAGSSASAVVFSLAAKDLGKDIVSGFIIQAWDGFNVDDIVLLEDNTEGLVSRIGLVDTEIILYNNIAIKIPNSQLTSIRISNLSRIVTTQLIETIKIQILSSNPTTSTSTSIDIDSETTLLSTIDNSILTTIENDIKNEIIKSCKDTIITNDKNKHPFIVSIQSIEPNNVIQLYISCHFNIPYTSKTQIAANKQIVLVAINTAIQRNPIIQLV